MKSQARRRLVSLVAVLLVLAATAAGAAFALSSSQSPIQQANTNMYRAGTNRFNVSVTLAASGKQYTLGARGAFDLRHVRGAFTVDFEMEFAGHGLGVLILPLAQRDARSQVPKDLGALKQRLESTS